jgi:hypothetical protein
MYNNEPVDPYISLSCITQIIIESNITIPNI